MPRNRFQLLLRTMHFSDNTIISEDRLQKLTPLLDLLKRSFQDPIIPGEFLCIDETLVPFRGRLKFKQYISNKRHKFGIKLFKLCLEGRYTYNFKIYCGKEQTQGCAVPTSVVMNLMTNLLDCGRTLCTDNYYTSVSLANALLQQHTHLIGTLRINRKFNPKDVINKKLKTGESTAAESNLGIIVQKWKDRRDVLILSTKFTDEMITIKKRTRDIHKPKNIIEYNKYKSYIDISDQVKSYNSSLRKNLKWYRKLAVELLVGTSLVNAFVAFKSITNETISITKFRELVMGDLIKTDKAPLPIVVQATHKLEDLGGQGKRRCTVCYEKLKAEVERIEATTKCPQTNLKCESCAKHFCLDCFFKKHNVSTKT